MKKDNIPTYKIYLPFLLAACTALGMIVGQRFSSESLISSNVVQQRLLTKNSDGVALQEIIKYVDNRYVDSVASGELVNVAANAILDRLDPHSVYISPEEIASINQGMSGYYKGLGIETIFLLDTLRVIKVLKNSPADESGIEYGDKIISSNDTILAGKNRTKEEQWEFLKTTDQKEFNLVVLKKNNDLKNLTVYPSRIKTPNVDYLSKDNIAYINVLRFSDETYEGLIDALEAVQKDKVIDKLILDLRNNPGGYLPEATKILNQFFVEDKRLLVYTEDRNNRKSEYNTTGRPFYQINKLVVLINGGSASASEIIAGALQDWDKAILVGNKTFGKGLVQEQLNLSNGGALRLTTARYYTPTGRSIQKPYSETNSDTSAIHYSKIYNRELDSHGGVSADIEVEWTKEQLEIISNLSENISTTCYKIIENINGNDIAKVNIEIADYLEVNYQIDAKYREFAHSFLLVNVLDQLGEEQKYTDEFFNHDVFIKEAIYQLNKSDIFADLID
jgi:carboxyl-terminal processing protease